MTNLAADDDLAVDDFECFGVVFGALPAGKVFAIEQGVPTVGIGFGGFFVGFGRSGGNLAGYNDYGDQKREMPQVSHEVILH